MQVWPHLARDPLLWQHLWLYLKQLDCYGLASAPVRGYLKLYVICGDTNTRINQTCATLETKHCEGLQSWCTKVVYKQASVPLLCLFTVGGSFV